MNQDQVSQIFRATIFPEGKLIAFYGGVLSQWNKKSFTCEELLPGITLNCAEQGMMLLKAKEFGDHRAFENILQSANPKNQKAFGREVKNFNPEQWEKVTLEYVTQLSFSKYSQTKLWADTLISTEGYTIVEASPYDRVWGIGMAASHPDILNRQKWRGRNKLGKAIMAARQKLIENTETC
jgi:ribA/ribD-fused uncharacterized protein